MKKGYSLYDQNQFTQASSSFLSVYEKCSHSYNVIRSLLECILRSNNNTLLHEGMKIIKSILHNTAQYLHDCSLHSGIINL